MRFFCALIMALAVTFARTGVATAGHVSPGPTGGTDVKVTADNNNLPSTSPATPGFDAQNDAQNEPSIAISRADPRIVAILANDFRMLQRSGFAWTGLYVSSDSGATWFNTMPPGFPTDATPAGAASGLLGMTISGDPVVRFDAAGNLYLLALAFTFEANRNQFGPNNLIYIARYHYTPGTPGGVSTPTSAANPPNFTYAFTTIVDRGSVALVHAHGRFEDKPWLGIDTNPSSPCFGSVYVAFLKADAERGSQLIVLSRSTDLGLTFSQPRPIAVSGQAGSVSTFAASLHVAADGALYAAYRTGFTSADPANEVRVVRSDDCGRKFTKPVTVAPVRALRSPIVPRVGALPQVAADDLNPSTVYVAFPSLSGSPANPDIFVARSTDRGATWEAPTRVNDDTTSQAQFFPTIAVSHGAVHVAWYDLRDSTPDQQVLNVYYASSNTSDAAYPLFSHNVRVSDVGFDPNCNILLGSPSGPFIGDYIELDARFDGINHIVHVAWADNRDIRPCVPPNIPFPQVPPSQGVFNQNVYTDRLIVKP